MTAAEPVPADPSVAEAVGWATVDLDRAAAELAPLLAAGSDFRAAPGSVHLGARCRIGPMAGDTGANAALLPVAARGAPRARFIVLLEPSTEGRLAATLARHGESWCATWVLGRTATATSAGAGPGGGAERRSASRSGPLGPERLVLGGPIAGPHRLLVTAATIEP